jgi:hypothetical protein
MCVHEKVVVVWEFHKKEKEYESILNVLQQNIESQRGWLVRSRAIDF